MIEVRADLIGKAPIVFSRAIQSIKNQGEADDAFEDRCWRERLHVDEHDNVFIPPFAMKRSLEATGKYLAESVRGKGAKKYTTLFKAGTMCTEPLMLTNGSAIKGKSVASLRLFVPSDGRQGGGKRVFKNFPIIPSWSTKVLIHVLDPILIDHPEKVWEYLQHAGKFDGLGAFRPGRGGYYGRYEVASCSVGTVPIENWLKARAKGV